MAGWGADMCECKELRSFLPKDAVMDGSVDYATELQAALDSFKEPLKADEENLTREGGFNV